MSWSANVALVAKIKGSLPSCLLRRRGHNTNKKLIMKVRNLILGLAVAFAGFASLGEANAQKTFEKGTQTASIMIGLPSTTGLFSSIVVPPLTAVYEYGVVGNLFSNGKGTIGVGGQGEYVLFRSGADNYSGYFFFGGRGALHYEFVPQLDTYAGLALGWSFVGGAALRNSGAFGTQGFVGARYYVTPTLALGGELGYGLTLVNLGVTFRF